MKRTLIIENNKNSTSNEYVMTKRHNFLSFIDIFSYLKSCYCEQIHACYIKFNHKRINILTTPAFNKYVCLYLFIYVRIYI